jgi:glycosyltransferase involved in cell wall biosynthesis
VVVDARPLHTSGIGRYLREVLSRLLRDARFGTVTLLGDAAQLQGFLEAERPSIETRVQPFPTALYHPRAHAAWLRLTLAGRLRADVTFFPHYDTPLVGFPRRSVVTVHDLIHFRVPDAFAGWQRAAAGVVLGRAVTRASGILAGSASTRRDLLERFPAAADKVRVIPYGVGEEFVRAVEASDLADSEAADVRALGPYLLCVGNRKRHKNLRAAVETLALLHDEMPELKLVVVGRVFPEWEETLRLAAERGVADAIVEFEDISDARLRQLYAGCRALLFPSLYEGFGLPVLEAMACGAPVVTSDRSSLPEVAGDAALMVDPHDWSAMAGAVRRLEGEPGLRGELQRRGWERVARFRWERTGEIVLDLLHRVGTGTTVPT